MGSVAADKAALHPKHSGEKPTKKAPERRCIVAGGDSGPRDPLLRFVVSPDGILVFDATEKLPGRGCYVTADPTLLATAIAKKQFARALKGPVTVPADLEAQVVSALSSRVMAALGLAKKAGTVALGEIEVDQALKREQLTLLLAASDASDRTADDLVGRATRHQIPCYRLPFTAAAFGAALGRDNSVYLGLLDGGAVTGLPPTLVRDCARLAPFVTSTPESRTHG